MKSSAKSAKQEAILIRGTKKEIDAIRNFCERRNLVIYRWLKGLALDEINQVHQGGEGECRG